MNKKARNNLILLTCLGIVLLSFVLLVNAGQVSYEEDGVVCDNSLYSRTCVDANNETSFEVFGDKFWNGTTWQILNKSFSIYNQNGYYLKTTSAPYTLYAKENSNFGDGIKYCVKNNNSVERCLIYQAQDMQYRNNVGSQDYISSIQSKSLLSNNTIIRYNDVFSGVDLEYTNENANVKENFIVYNLSKQPASWLGDIRNVTLDFGGYIKYDGLKLYVDGVEKTTNFKTSEYIEFRDDETGEVLFSLPKPYALDSADDKVDLEYEVKFQGGDIFFYLKTPFDWINKTNRVYPLYIDPSLEVNSGTTSLGGDLVYDYVYVAHGATLSVNATGYLSINATENITIYGTLTGLNTGGTQGSGGGGNSYIYACQDLPGSSGGGGGGHASNAGAGGSGGTGTTPGSAGASYGNATNLINFTRGSGSGTGGVYGGSPGGSNPGSGAIRLFSPIIIINGSINLNGGVGGNGGQSGGVTSGGGGGGGSGGTLLILGQDITLNNSIINVNGGNGGAGAAYTGGECAPNKCSAGGGGGGAGGYIKIFYENTFQNNSMTYNIAGGSGGAGTGACGSSGGGGNVGTYYVSQEIDLGFSATFSTNITYPLNISYNTNVSNLNYTITGESLDSCWYSRDGGTTNESIVSAGTNFTGITSTEGSNTWIVYCNDSSNNLATDSVTFFKDLTYPTINISESSFSNVIAGENNLSWNITEGSVDTIWWDYNSTNTTLSGLVNSTTFNIEFGNYSGILWVNDTAGNINYSSITWNGTQAQYYFKNGLNQSILNPTCTFSSGSMNSSYTYTRGSSVEETISCSLTGYTSLSETYNISDGDKNFTMYPTFYVSTLTHNPSTFNYLNYINLTATLNLVENVTYCNFTLKNPSNYSVVNNLNGSLIEGVFKYTNIFVNQTGTYAAYVNCSRTDGLNVSKTLTFDVDYYLSHSDDFTFTAIKEKNETNKFNMTFFDNTNGEITYNLESDIDDAGNFTIAFSQDSFILNSTDTNINPYKVELSINASNDIYNATYYGNITISNSTYNLTYVVDFTYFINPPSGEASIYGGIFNSYCTSYMFGECAKTEEVKIGDDTSVEFMINNTGEWDMSECNIKFANNSFGLNQFGENPSWVNVNTNNFSMPVGISSNLIITFTPSTSQSTTTDYLGFVYVKCDNGDFVGNPVTTQIDNRPYVQIDVDPVDDSVIEGGLGSAGGAEAPKVIIGTNETMWTMETQEGSGEYFINMIAGTIRTKSILFENLGVDSREINLTCEDVKGDLCQYVSFSEDSFTLEVLKGVKVSKDFMLNVPASADKKEYVINIRATDDLEQSGVVTTYINLDLNPFQEVAVKISSSKDIGEYKLPYSIIFFFVWISISVILYYTILKKSKIGLASSIFVGLLLSLSIIYLL